MQRNRFLLSLAIALFLSTLAAADSAPVTMTFLSTGSNNSGGYYTYPYYFSINGGQATPLMCDSFSNHVSVGESWRANVTGLLSGKGLFGQQLIDYKAAGLIFMGVMNEQLALQRVTGVRTFSRRVLRPIPLCSLLTRRRLP